MGNQVKLKNALLIIPLLAVVSCVSRPVQSRKEPDRPPVRPFTLNEAQIVKAKELVTRNLKDPESARFSGISGITQAGMSSGYAVCGNINAKNSYGGYTGDTPFIVEGENVDIGEDLQSTLLVEYRCTGR